MLVKDMWIMSMAIVTQLTCVTILLCIVYFGLWSKINLCLCTCKSLPVLDGWDITVYISSCEIKAWKKTLCGVS